VLVDIGQALLDAARTLALTDGPRAVTVAAIAGASGAPSGTLYHRFGSRDGILRAAWLRALEGFQARWLEAARDPDPLEAGVAMVDLPHGVVRRHAHTSPMPRWLERDVADAARRLLTARRAQPRADDDGRPSGR
jgi:AcrR family transcriptional regulator